MGADLGHGDVEVQFEGEDSPCEENYKHHKCSILKICELNLEVETDDGYQVLYCLGLKTLFHSPPVGGTPLAIQWMSSEGGA